MDPLANPKDFSKELVNKVLASAQLTRSFPTYDEMLYYTSIEPQLKPIYENIAQKLLDITQIMLNTQKTVVKINNLTDPDDVADKYDDIIDVTDLLLEEVDPENITQSTSENNAAKNTIVKSIEYGKKVYHTFQPHHGAIERPQLKFEPVDNSPTPFVPKIKTKPNAIKSLDEVFAKKTAELSENLRNHISSLGIDTTAQSWPHPYEHEIDNFQYSEKQLVARTEKLYAKLENTPCSFITTRQDIKLLCDKLNRVEEFAIDLEQHSYYSFLGFVCLMQISTRNEDFLIDTLELRHDLHILNDPFTNPKIVKVLHGSDSDVVWLQRDFGLYLVNMFDTGQAARVLEYPKFSLAYLLDHFCSVKADKQFQLADWRVRPLPSELYNYARTDTHYLLYIYDRMHNELISKGNRSNNLLLAVLNRSRELCKKRFEKESIQFLKESLYSKINVSLTPNQMKVLDALFLWRDRTARTEDQSVAYILPNHMLVKIAELGPEDKNALFRICKPGPTPCLKSNFEDVLRVIRDAKQDISTTIQKTTIISAAPKISIPAFAAVANQFDRKDVGTPEISQDELFEQADWLMPNSSDLGNKRTAEFDFSNTDFKIACTPSSNLFAFHAPNLDKKKIDKIHANITAKTNIFAQSFELTPSNSPVVVRKSSEDVAKDEVVPQSMEEIYQLSNQNRKRNKEKKKLKEDSLNTVSSPTSDDSSEKMNVDEVKNEDTQEFMKKIGWLSESQNNNNMNNNKDNQKLKKQKNSRDDSSNNNNNNNIINNNNNNQKNNKKFQNKGGNKTFPPGKQNNSGGNFQSFDYSKSESKSNFGLGDEKTSTSSNRPLQNTSISVPNLGRGANRANRGKARSQIFKGNNMSGKGNNK